MPNRRRSTVNACPCLSGLPGCRDHTGAMRCPCCQRAKRLHGKGIRIEVDTSRETISRQARARNAIQNRREALDALA